MFIIWVLVLVVLIFCIAGVFMGAPYLPTLKRQVEAALELADLKRGQTLIELGAGDGRVLIAAAKKGIYSIGYELNPLLFSIAYLRTRRYRQYVKIYFANYWHKSWPAADAVFVFLINRYMPRLDRYLTNYRHKPLKLVSFAFKIPNKKVAQEKDGVYLYLYP